MTARIDAIIRFIEFALNMQFSLSLSQLSVIEVNLGNLSIPVILFSFSYEKVYQMPDNL